MAKDLQPNYFSIIPASVRYDKDLPPLARLLFSELTALCNKEGYCWANNKYFASLYDVTPQTVSKWISDLSDKGYIKIAFEPQDNGTNKRQIFIDTPLRENPTPLTNNRNTHYEKDDTPLKDNRNPPYDYSDTPLTNNLNHNNTFNNTSSNTDNNKKEYTAKADAYVLDRLKVISELNALAGRNFDPEADYFKKNLNARIKQYGVPDLIDMIRFIVYKRKGTDWEQYLKPDTIFRADKCASYMVDMKHHRDNGIKPKKDTSKPSGPQSMEDFMRDVAAVQERRKHSII